MRKTIRRTMIVTIIFTLLCASSVFAKTYVDSTNGLTCAQITGRTETMKISKVPAGIPYALENNSDIAVAILIDGVPAGALAPRTIDPTGEYYRLDCVLVDHPLATVDTLRYDSKTHIMSITRK